MFEAGTEADEDVFDFDVRACRRREINDGLLSFEDDFDEDFLSPSFKGMKVFLESDFSTDCAVLVAKI